MNVYLGKGMSLLLIYCDLVDVPGSWRKRCRQRVGASPADGRRRRRLAPLNNDSSRADSIL